MSYIVAVPSRERVETANTKTLRLLADRGIDRDVHVFVAASEIDAYRAGLDPALYTELHVGADDLATQRNVIYDTFPEGARLVCCDDDLDDVVRRIDDKTTEQVVDLRPVIDRAFAACATAGASLWGVYPVLNPMFMKAGTTTDLRFCIGHLWGVVNTHESWAKATMREKGDYERSLARYEHDGAVVRLNDIAAKTRMGAKGGIASCAGDNRRTVNRASVLELQRRFPGWVTIAKRRSAIGLEILIGDKRGVAAR